MLELLVLGGLVGAVVLLPLMLVGLVLRLAFHIVLLPLEILGGLLGAGIIGMVLGLLGLVFLLIFGVLAAAGILVAIGPLLVVALLLWLVLRRRGDRGPAAVRH